MRFSLRPWCLALVAAFGVSLALACGPDFPWQLLDRRAGTLKAVPANSFAFEASRLVVPDDALRAVEPEGYGEPDIAARVNEAEAADLAPDQRDAVRAMRGAEGGEAAYGLGGVVPAAVRLYVAGAVEFRADAFETAVGRFDAVLRLTEPERRPRAVWAAFMLGRAQAKLDATGRAAAAFAEARRLARAGAPDPLGLAVDSYGEEARLHWRRALARLDGDTLPPSETDAFAKDAAAAARLYAEQAARGSDSGVQSLRIVAAKLLELPDAVPAAIADPLLQRLLVAYALARVGDVDAAQLGFPPVSRPPKILATLAAAIEARGLDRVAGADRLAALAYRLAQYELAAKLAERAEGPLALWLRAKLALQAGDLAAAAGFHARARQAAGEDVRFVMEPALVRRLAGEDGVLALARGEIMGALKRLHPLASSYWGDLAFVAERVATLDELKAFVDAHAPAGAAPRHDPEYEWLGWSGQTDQYLRDLLARRLVRSGRFAEAAPYFTETKNREDAAAYGEALATAATGWWAAERAEAWFDAAKLARHAGMEIMGYEADPDFQALGGNFPGGVGQSELPADFVSAAERQRFLATAAQPNNRYHYRYVAAAHAERAVALLPPRSQAFAAVLCHAAQWMFDSGAEARARALYRRYLREGAYQAWASEFGRSCPEPDFAAAASFTWRQLPREARRFASTHRWDIVAVAGLALAVAAGWMARRRRPATA